MSWQDREFFAGIRGDANRIDVAVATRRPPPCLSPLLCSRVCCLALIVVPVAVGSLVFAPTLLNRLRAVEPQGFKLVTSPRNVGSRK